MFSISQEFTDQCPLFYDRQPAHFNWPSPNGLFGSFYATPVNPPGASNILHSAAHHTSVSASSSVWKILIPPNPSCLFLLVSELPSFLSLSLR